MAKGKDDKSRRELITPEGIPLVYHLAGVGDRCAAFFIDFLIMGLAIAVLGILLAFANADFDNGWGMAAIALIVFFVTNFYFMFFEVRWQGATPGKRSVGIKVLDGRGGRLTAEAIISRNLMRQVEVFVPLGILGNTEQIFPNTEGMAAFLCTLWLLALMSLPILNRERLRAGDMVAGTRVVLAPKVVLLQDIGADIDGSPSTATYEFADAQLKMYGIYELQTLEKVLRSSEAVDRDQTVATVCEKIKTKIKWDKARWEVNNERFLSDFYVAQRAYLERNMLFGKRVTDKFSAQKDV